MKQNWLTTQRRWNVWGWCLMLTWGQNFAIGIWTGWSWVAIRVNGFSIHLGPLAIDIQPPPPKWLDVQ